VAANFLEERRMFENVLILSASAGAGHIRAAEALEKAFIRRGAARRVRHVDTLEYTTKVFRDIYSKAYIDLVNRSPELLGWLYDYLDKPWKDEPALRAMNKLNTRPFVKMIEEYRPDIAVCTHFLPAEIITYLKDRQRLHCPLALVVTDFDIHAMWLCRGCQRYFVALEETKVHLERLGIDPGTVTVSGIPVDPVFAETVDKETTREELGLDRGRTTILLSAGGFGVGPMENLISSLGELRHEAQVVAICGRNDELRARLEQRARDAGNGPVQLKPLGYTREMDRYMAASDLLVGKPGGLTTSEALARGLVMVIVNPIPGQEERNADHLLEQGCAIRCNNLPVLGWKIDRLLDDGARLAAMRENVRRLAKPDAAGTVVRTLLAQWANATPEV